MRSVIPIAAFVVFSLLFALTVAPAWTAAAAAAASFRARVAAVGSLGK